MTKAGNRYIVTLVDYFSKWPEAAPLKDKSAAGIALFLFHLFCRYLNLVSFKIMFTTNFIFRYGCCKIIISNQGREFVNCLQTELFQLTGAEHRVTSAYHPQSNGLTERFKQTLQVTLMKLVNDEQNDWDEHLPAILFSYRTSLKKTTKLTPFEVLYCRYVIYCLT